MLSYATKRKEGKGGERERVRHLLLLSRAGGIHTAVHRQCGVEGAGGGERE